ncbi:hypothetical protein [Ekhidna sp.]
MKYLFVVAFIFFTTVLFGQGEFETLATDQYSIKYPSTWEVNQTGQMGMAFGLFSPAGMQGDQFRENVNLIIQDISSQNLDLVDFVSLSENQITTMIVDGNLLVSEKKDGYHQMIYTGTMGQYKLKFQQYYWVIGGNAYILTFTAEQNQYDNYIGVAQQLMDSFEIR